MSNQNQLQALNEMFEEMAEALQPTLEFMRNQIESTIEAIVPVLHALQSDHDAHMAVIDETMAIPGNAHLTNWTFEIVEIEESTHD